MCPCCYQQGGSLLHCLSTLTGRIPAVYFCCTGLGVTSTGRYPASCPVKPGLSSSAPFRDSQPRLFILPAPVIQYHTWPSLASPSSTIRSSPSAAVVASSSHRSFCGWPSCPFTQINVILCGFAASKSLFQRSMFLTGSFFPRFQPFRIQLSIQRWLKASTR